MPRKCFLGSSIDRASGSPVDAQANTLERFQRLLRLLAQGVVRDVESQEGGVALIALRIRLRGFDERRQVRDLVLLEEQDAQLLQLAEGLQVADLVFLQLQVR